MFALGALIIGTIFSESKEFNNAKPKEEEKTPEPPKEKSVEGEVRVDGMSLQEAQIRGKIENDK